MKHRIRRAVMVSVVVIAGSGAHPASANPGLLHKHGPRHIGVPAMLPGQTFPGGAAATTTAPAVGAASGAATSSVAIAAVATCGDGAAGGAAVLIGGADGTPIDPGLLPACNLPIPVGTAHGGDGGPNVFHKLNPGFVAGDPGPIDPGMIDPGLVLIDGVPPGIDPNISGGMIDGGPATGGVVYAMAPGGRGADGGGPRFFHHQLSGAGFSATSSAAGGLSAAPAAATDSAGSGGRALAGGLPNRAAGVRTDAVATIRHHGQGAAAPAAVVAVSGDDSSDGVVQAGGVTDTSAGGASHKGRSRLAGDPAAGRAAVAPAAGSAPRWRDRLRFAWPTPK